MTSKPTFALPAEAMMLLNAVDNMTDGLILLDAQDRFIFCNDRYREMYPEVEDLLVAGTPLDDIISTYSGYVHSQSPEGAALHSRHRNQAWRSRTNMEELTPGGRWIETRDYKTEGGYWIGIRIDVTERREAEQRLREFNETLERRVEERTQELAEAHRALVRKERLTVLGQLTGTVAHELRNPLGTLAATIEFIATRGRDDPDLHKALDRATRNVFRCNAIIDELLSYARTSGDQRVPTPFDSWLNETLSKFDVPSNIRLSRTLEAGPRRVALDRERFRRVILNVVTNAIEALHQHDRARAGHIRVTSSAADDSVLLSVTDDGPGVPEDVLENIFEPLFSTKSFGVGLGLPIVARTVHEHGGEIDLSNLANGGVRVDISLPTHRD